MNRANSVLATLLMAVLASTAHPTSSDTVANSALLQGVFAQSTRVVLRGEAGAQLVSYCALEGTKPSTRRISEAQLDELEATLLPLLRDDLVSAGSKLRAQEYYRQYAAADWKEHRMIYVIGFHERSGAADSTYWKSKPVIVNDGGAAYWCAVYIQDAQRFVRMQQEGLPVRTVLFNGNA